jgi:hypothetical protein
VGSTNVKSAPSSSPTVPARSAMEAMKASVSPAMLVRTSGVKRS